MARYKRLKDGTFQEIDDSETAWDQNEDGTFSKRTKTNAAPQNQLLIKHQMRTMPSVNIQKEEKRTWFDKGAFSDGYQFGDVTKTILGTATDIGENINTAVLEATENLIDTTAYGVGAIGGIYSDKFRDNTKEFIAKDLLNTKENGERMQRYLSGDFLTPLIVGKDIEGASILGDKADGIVQSGAHLAGQAALQYVGVPWWLTSGVNSFGGEIESAFNEDASYLEAGISGAITTGAELLTEKLSGGIKFGGKALDDVLLKPLTEKISNNVVKTVVNWGLDAGGEGLEEVVSQFVSTLGQQLTYEREETVNELLNNEEAMNNYISQVGNALFGKEARKGYGEAFTGGVILGGGANVGRTANSIMTGRDHKTGLTANEQKVVDSVVSKRISEQETNGKKLKAKEKAEIEQNVLEELKKGYIDIDTIESALGGDSYAAYDSLVKESEEFDTLNKIKNMERTGEQDDRLAELKERNKAKSYKDQLAELRSKLSDEVFGATQNDMYLQESYNEKGRRSQAFEADLKQYEAKQQETIQKAIDSGILNNTRRTHEFVELIAKISADKGVSFNFTDNAKLKESGFALEGKTVNGYINGTDITLNINSAKALNKVVGHEITHVLEGTEHYAELQKAVFEYAKNKNDYEGRLETLTELYKDVENADVSKELTADLIGDYLFSDEKFVQQLSSQNRNVFQKIYDEIKYLVKTVTAGSKEAKKLEKVKKVFEQIYKENGKIAEGSKKFSLGEVVDKNNNSYGIGVHLDSTLLDNLSANERIELVKEYVKELGGQIFSAYDTNGNAINITIANSKRFKNSNGKKVPANKDLQTKYIKNETKQEAIALVDELVLTAKYDGSKKPNYSHDWLDNNGKNDWEYWTTYVQDKNNTIWEVTLNIANSSNGEKILYDINPIKKVGQSVKSDTSPTSYSISQKQKNATEIQKKSLSNDDIAPIGNWSIKGEDIALEGVPIRQDIAPAQQDAAADDLMQGPFTMDEDVQEERKTSQEDEIIQFRKKSAEKIKNIEAKIKGLQMSKDISKREFDESIAKKKKEYDDLKRKDTERASKLLTQINNLEYRRNRAIADIDRKIEGNKKAMENIKSQEVARQRKLKQSTYRNQMSELMGDTSTWVDKKMGYSYQVNTLRRNLRDVVRNADGKKDIAKADSIYDELQGKYNQNEAELNRESNRIKQVFADMKINSKENAYIQMLGEYRHNPDTTITPDVIKEYYEKHKGKIDDAKVDKAIELSRQLYDDLFQRLNSVLREQGMKEIGYREGYFPHFTEDKQNPFAKAINWKTQNNDIPTDIAGLTEQFNPNRSWQSFNKHRTGDSTDYNFKKGLDTYVQGALDWIYHIEDIQKRRAFENEIRYRHSDKGIQDKIDEIYNNPFYDADEVQAKIDEILKEAKNPLNNFVTDLRKGTNVLAGKKDSGDRYIEEKTSRKIYSTMTNISNRVTANMVAGSVSSALTNFIPITQSWGQVSPISSLKAMKDTVKSIVVKDGVVDKSDFLTNRLRQAENLYKTGWDKVGNTVGLMMEVVDNFTSQTVWRSKYIENMQNGMSEETAIKNADQFAENVMAGRSRGNTPTIFNEKNLATKMITAFQLEVANQYGYMFKDMPQDMQNERKAKLVKGYATMYVGAYVYNKLYSALTGRDAAFDPIGILEDLLRDLGLFDEEEKKEPAEVITNLATNVVEELPFVGGLIGGGRIPISSALPYDGLTIDSFSQMMKDMSEGDMKNFWQEMLNPVYYVGMPMGGGQLRKTIQGLSMFYDLPMFDDKLPIAGSYTNSGKLRFSVDDTLMNKAQAAVFGQYANKNAREYFDRERTPLNEKNTQELVDLEIPISEYWDIQDKIAEKADTIADLDLPIAKKNLLINNRTDRKDPIDLTDYDLYEDFEEFDFASKNPDKYKFLQENNITYQEYNKSKDTRKTYNWAYENPKRITVSKAIGDLFEYKKYTNTLNNIVGNKDSNGKTISGSKKMKVTNYINGLDLNYGQKLILFKQEYPSDDTYNYEIVEYLNGRNDLSYSEIKTILEEIGFEVAQDGTVRW